jgi:integrase
MEISNEQLIEVFAEAQKVLKQREAGGKKKKHSPTKKAPVSLSDDELLKVLALGQAKRLRDWVLMLLTYRHGLRASEALNIRRRDLDGAYLRIRRGKGSEETEQPLLGHENPLLNEIAAVAIWLGEMGTRGKKGGAKVGGRRSRAKILHSHQNVKFRTVGDPDERLFPLTRQRYYQLFHDYATEAGLPGRKRSPHKLKHSTATHLLRSGVPVNEVQDWCGWKSLATMNRYTRPHADEVAHSVDRAIRGKDSFRQIRQGVLFGDPASGSAKVRP